MHSHTMRNMLKPAVSASGLIRAILMEDGCPDPVQPCQTCGTVFHFDGTSTTGLQILQHKLMCEDFWHSAEQRWYCSAHFFSEMNSETDIWTHSKDRIARTVAGRRTAIQRAFNRPNRIRSTEAWMLQESPQSLPPAPRQGPHGSNTSMATPQTRGQIHGHPAGTSGVPNLRYRVMKRTRRAAPQLHPTIPGSATSPRTIDDTGNPRPSAPNSPRRGRLY